MNKLTKIISALAAVAVVVITTAGCSAASTDTDTTATPASTSAAEPPLFIMSGSVTLTDSEGVSGTRSAAKCFGNGGYDDLRVGAPVVVYGPDGAMVAVGAINDAISHPHDMPLGKTTYPSDECEFTFAVPSVPTGLKIYSYEVTHRGKLPVTEAAAKAGVSASIG